MNHATTTRNRAPSAAADAARLVALEDYAALAASLWASVCEAAYRGEPPVISVHCRQIAAVTREAFAVAKTLGSPADQGEAA